MRSSLDESLEYIYGNSSDIIEDEINVNGGDRQIVGMIDYRLVLGTGVLND